MWNWELRTGNGQYIEEQGVEASVSDCLGKAFQHIFRVGKGDASIHIYEGFYANYEVIIPVMVKER